MEIRTHEHCFESSHPPVVGIGVYRHSSEGDKTLHTSATARPLYLPTRVVMNVDVAG